MSFSTAWLDLREPADHASRDPALLEAARRWLATGDSPLAVDLGAGTGSTLRAFAMEGGATWRLVDADPVLLVSASTRHATGVETLVADLGQVDAIPIEGARLVTASALFDLVSADWISRFADRLASTGAALYAALTYDGAMAWTPADPDDEAITRTFNRHQRSDKGFGPALGPEAGAALETALRRQGYRVETAPSPWRLGPSDAALHAELLRGIADAARETGQDGADQWLSRRLAVLDDASCVIGHGDLLALPPG